MSERVPLVFAPGMRSAYYVGYVRYRGSHDRLLRVIERAGFDLHFFQPDWRDPRPLSWATEMASLAENVAKSRDSEQVVLAGFSCGALIATLAAVKMEEGASEIKAAGLAAFSLSPWFGLDRIRRALSRPTSDLHNASESLKGALSELELPKLNCPAQLYAGTQEMSTVLDMQRDAFATWPQACRIQPPTEHNVFDDSYLRAIEQNIGHLAAPGAGAAAVYQ